jgi:hypothetical protein
MERLTLGRVYIFTANGKVPHMLRNSIDGRMTVKVVRKKEDWTGPTDFYVQTASLSSRAERAAATMGAIMRCSARRPAVSKPAHRSRHAARRRHSTLSAEQVRRHFMTLPICDQPATIASELAEEIRHAVYSIPRTLQASIGPSELGTPCTRSLLHKVNGDSVPDRKAGGVPVVPWLSFIGTVMHAELAGIMSRSAGQGGADGPRYLVEHRVEVGSVAGKPVSGTADLFDIPAGCVVDWKVVGPTTLKRAKAARHPGRQYEWQAHLYGRGFTRQGYTVNTVLIMFLPRNGQFAERYSWSAPYDESVALQALAHVTGLVDLTAAIGIDAALQLFPPCANVWCSWCGTTYAPRSFFDMKGESSNGIL